MRLEKLAAGGRCIRVIPSAVTMASSTSTASVTASGNVSVTLTSSTSSSTATASVTASGTASVAAYLSVAAASTSTSARSALSCTVEAGETTTSTQLSAAALAGSCSASASVTIDKLARPHFVDGEGSPDTQSSGSSTTAAAVSLTTQFEIVHGHAFPLHVGDQEPAQPCPSRDYRPLATIEGAPSTETNVLNAPHMSDIWGERGEEHPGFDVPSIRVRVHDFGPLLHRYKRLPWLRIVPKKFKGVPRLQAGLKAWQDIPGEPHH